MAKNACVTILSDYEKRFCEADNISKNDLAVFFYKYLESTHSNAESLTEEVLNSDTFKGWYNWYFKLGNSRFLVENPASYKVYKRNWDAMKSYGMDNEGYLTIDTPKKNTVLNWIKQSKDFETHFVVYKDLNGNTVLKVEKPIYTGKQYSKTQMMELEGTQIQSVEDIQNLLKDKHIIHRFMGKWRTTKTKDGFNRLQELINDKTVDGSVIRTYDEGNTVVVEFEERDSQFDNVDYALDVSDNVIPTFDLNTLKTDSEVMKNIITSVVQFQAMENRMKQSKVHTAINSFKKGDAVTPVELLSVIRDNASTEEYRILASALIPLFKQNNIMVEFVGKETRGAAGRVRTNDNGLLDESVKINVDTVSYATAPEVTMLHELTHALTTTAVRNSPTLRKALNQLMDTVKSYLETTGLPKDVTYKINGKGYEMPYHIYGLKNEREFIAEAFTNRNFQELLRNIPIEEDTIKTNAWFSFVDRIIDGLKSLFRRNYKKTTSVYDALVPIISDVMVKTASLGDTITGTEKLEEESWMMEVSDEQREYTKYLASTLLEYGGTSTEAEQTVNEGDSVASQVNPFEVGDRLYHQIRTTFGDKVAYSANFKKDHVYLVKDKNGQWVPVDYTVTQLTEEPFKGDDSWKPVAQGLGNTNDEFMRDFFAHNLKKSYPNLTKEQYDTLKRSAEEVVRYLDNLLGAGNYKVASQEFPILGYTTVDGKTKTVAGTMDLLVYDTKGDFYIIDMKTRRIEGNAAPDFSRKIEGYSRQQYMYKNILETAIPELRGRIKQPLLLVSTVSYPSPRDGYSYSLNDKGEVIASYTDANGATKHVPITQLSGYVAPKYHSFMSTQDVDKEIKEMLTVMTSEEFETEYGTPEIIKQSMEYQRKIVLDPKQSKEAAETEALYTIIPKEEVAFLGQNIASKFSEFVNILLTDKEANDDFFTDPDTGVNIFSQYDFTKMSREELLNVPFLIDNLLDFIKEDSFNIEQEHLASKDEGTKAKLNAAYNNFEALVKANYAEFIKLEGLTFNGSTEKTYVQDGVDGSIINTEDPSENEDNGREHWQIGIRNMSAMSGLSARLRRFLSTIEDIDSNGNPIPDRYGYGLSTTLNGNEVVNSLLVWLKDCNTLEEMETVLTNLSRTHFWINNLLDEIKEEPIRSQFFQCFRKDFTEYSTIITVKRTDQFTGLPRWETVNHIINSVGAVDKVIGEVKDAFFNRDIPIFKDGLFDIEAIQKIANKIVEVQTWLNRRENWDTLKEQLTDISVFRAIKGPLNRLGIQFDDTILSDIIVADTNIKNFAGSKLAKILTQAKYIADNLLEGAKKESYDPLERNGANNVYNSYKNIATIAEPYIVNALEASTYANGKMYYSFVSPSYMGQLFNNLINTDKESLEDFLQDNYGKYTWFKTGDSWNIQWLKDIELNRDTLARKVQLSYEGTDYVDLGERAYMLSLLREYFYDQKNKSLAWYRIPTLSNKPSSEFIRNKRYSGDFKKELTNQLYNIFSQELKRMQTVVDRLFSNSITAEDKIKNFDIKLSKNKEIKAAQQNVIDKMKAKKVVTREDLLVNGQYIFEDSGASFKFLDGFVEDIKIESLTGQYIIDKVFNRGVVVVKDGDAVSSIRTRIGEFMKAKTDATVEYFRSMSLNTTEMNFMLSGDSITKKTTPEEALSKLYTSIEEYVWNDFVATANIIQLTTTDLAYYKDSVDFQKRFAQVHAPGLRLNKTATNVIDGNKVKVSDGYLRSVLIADKISVSTIKENVRVALDNHYNSMEEGPAKEEFKIMKDMIVSSFESINEADAQAFTSPTGYMKKMVMAGEWNPLMQEAYERIKSGNYNVADLGVVWQPIKPFVYTQNTMTGHSTTSPLIKVPSQHKNSEYMLLIADALTRGDKQNNTLNALMDFMEETHYKNGKYSQDGIDTIEFDSAVKVGVHGVININNLSADEVKAKLSEAIKNEATIFKYPVEDYAIQQNVPAHFKEHTQPMGSQIRALVLSDLVGKSYTPLGSKTSYTPKQVNTVYQDLIARNVTRSRDKLVKDLGLTGDRLEQNQKLSNLLLEEMSKDARYGADIRRAVMLDANGEFVIPLDDPIHSSRIQQVINSIVKGRINKQRTKGGPVVQASSFGLSENLSIVFQDKNGRELPTITKFGKQRKLEGKELEIAYKKYIEDKQATVKHFECYIPLPSGLFEDLMLVDDGKGGKRTLSIEEATNPNSEYYVHGLKNCLNAIGFRIPTEDTYSMVPIKIAGFVPKAAGEVVMLPKEITLLSGSDFDKIFVEVKPL